MSQWKTQQEILGKTTRQNLMFWKHSLHEFQRAEATYLAMDESNAW